jgi:hypothetical protein
VLSFDAFNEVTKEADERVKELQELKEKVEKQGSQMESMQRGFEVLIKTGALDPIIENGGVDVVEGEENTSNMRSLVEKRRKELMQNERKRLLDLMNIPFTSRRQAPPPPSPG